MSLVRVWNSLFKAAIILINVVNEPLIAVMDLTLQLTTTYTPIGAACMWRECTHTHTHTHREGVGCVCVCVRMHMSAAEVSECVCVCVCVEE